MKWIHNHGHADETLVTQTGIALSEAALTALLYNHSISNTTCLKSAYLRDMTAASISLLGCFTSIAKVELSGDLERSPLADLNLCPLRGLPDLTSLALEHGTFYGLGDLERLTSFSVRDSLGDFTTTVHLPHHWCALL